MLNDRSGEYLARRRRGLAARQIVTPDRDGRQVLDRGGVDDDDKREEHSAASVPPRCRMHDCWLSDVLPTHSGDDDHRIRVLRKFDVPRRGTARAGQYQLAVDERQDHNLGLYWPLDSEGA
jgi:hypothetical protein